MTLVLLSTNPLACIPCILSVLVHYFQTSLHLWNFSTIRIVYQPFLFLKWLYHPGGKHELSVFHVNSEHQLRPFSVHVVYFLSYYYLYFNWLSWCYPLIIFPYRPTFQFFRWSNPSFLRINLHLSFVCVSFSVHVLISCFSYVSFFSYYFSVSFLSVYLIQFHFSICIHYLRLDRLTHNQPPQSFFGLMAPMRCAGSCLYGPNLLLCCGALLHRQSGHFGEKHVSGPWPDLKQFWHNL